MASFQPFEAAVKASVSGFTQTITVAGTINGVSTQVAFINSASAENPSILVTAWDPRATGATPMVCYMRMTVETSTGIIAAISNTDTPVVMIPQAAPQVRLYANPSPTGQATIAVMATLSITAAGAAPTFWFTPGEGGIV